MPPDAAQPPRLPFPVVGVGASAGGLEAFSELVQALPADTGMAYVFIQHLPPERESLLVELLARQTAVPVRHADDGLAVEPNHVYVIRPGHTLTLKDGRLWLGKELAARGHNRPVDDFFRSLAEEQQQRAIAVVLSGMGSNGSAGAQAVRAVGGLVVAQDPATAKFPSMPRALIDTNAADLVLRPGEMPEALARYAGHPYVAAPRPADPADAQNERALGEILTVLRTRTKYDFTGYRKPTLLRRVQRRMGLGQVTAVDEYTRALRQSPTEAVALADDLLIHVTGFFRDPEAWEALREKVIEPLVADRPAGAPIRCWVTACATGEEAYTLAMLVAEAAGAAGKGFDLKVFATDMAERALGYARAGVYPLGIESEVTPERLARFFDRDDSLYRVKRELREAVVFAPQNVLHDPPFSRLDIATCRNLLIYLEPDTQQRVLQLLHFGLREGGALMLGTSESVGPAEDQFEPIDKKHRLFRRVGPTRHGTINFPTLLAPAARPSPPPGQPPSAAAVGQLAERVLLEGHTPAAVVADPAGRVVYVHGDTARFLTLPRGEPTQDLLALANEQVRAAVRTALHRVADLQTPVTVRDGVIDTPDGRRRVEVGATPLGRPGGGGHVLVTFHDYPEPAPDPAAFALDGDDRALAAELARARHELQSTIEELQTSNEEMRASQEEASSINEELQSTNEELETSKEELQSLNEELTTVNAQLQAKMAELEATASDLSSLLASVDIAVLFLDPRFRIRRYTPATRDLFELIASDVGRPLTDLRRKFTDPDLLPDARAVLDKLVPVEREIESESGRAYLRRVLPYRTLDNRIDGVVVAFVDVTDRRRTEAARRQSEERFRAFVTASADVVYRMSPDWAEMRQLDGRGFLADTPTPTAAWLDAYIHPDDQPPVRAAIAAAVRGGTVFELEHRVRRADGTLGWVLSRAVPLRDPAGAVVEWFGAAADVTARKEAEERLRASEENYRTLFDGMAEGYTVAQVLRDEAGRATDLRYQELNPAFERQSGMAREQLLGRRLTEVFPPADVGRWLPVYARAADTGEAATVEQYVELLDRWYEVSVYPRGGDRLAFFYRDVTARKRTEAALRAGEERYRALVENVRDHAIFSLDLAGVVTTWNDGAEQVFGWTAAEMIGRSGDELFTPEDRAAGLPERERATVIAAGRASDENWAVRKGGDRFWASGGSSAVRDAAGRLTGFVKVVRDQTERQAAEAAVREGQERLRLALEAARMGIWRWEVAADVHTRDANLNRLLGLPAAETRQPLADFLALVHPDDRPAVAAGFDNSIRRGHNLSLEFRVVWPDGTVRWLRDQGDVFDVSDGAGRHLTGAAVDITDLKEAEAALRQARDELEARVRERTAELAEVVAELRAEMAERQALARRLATAQEEERARIARELHDRFSQYLTGLHLGLANLRTQHPPDGPERSALDRLVGLADEMGREAHRLAVELRPTALDDAGLEVAVQAHVERWAAAARLPTDFGSRGFEAGPVGEPAATAVYRAVQECLTNVLKHAAASRVSVLLDRKPDALEAIVEDDGRGFDPDAPRDPARPGGLGLVGMNERITLAGGTLQVESAPGAGTTVYIRVPLSPPPRATP